MNQAIISVGSNIEPERNCYQAYEILNQEHTILSKSSFRVTAPVGYQNQPDFLNGAFCIETSLERLDFNHYLKQVERRLGRIKGPIKSGPRTIDLDIIIWNRYVVHDDFYSRDYVYPFVQDLIHKHQIVLQDNGLLATL